ncbi:MAG: DNA polymerase I [Bacteroidales bacterium]|nr:DNA polymerase I [Bacteroidales bacterium]
MDNNEKKLFLLDAYALIYRAFFALNRRPAVNSKGLNTSAVMGFLNTLYEVLRVEKPTHIGVAFDLHAPTTRQQEYSDYKANREAMPDDLRASIPYILKLIEGFNIPVYAAEGYEADDIIGTLSHKAEQQGFVTYMMTPDKDFGQLVTDKVFMYKPAKFGAPSQVWGPKEVCERYGIEHPTQLIDILGLWGDASDNIPGIPGIGEKNASILVAKYGSVENLIAHADELKGKQKENVINFAEQGLLSKRLATIMLDAPVDLDEEELRVHDPNVPALLELFDELEFRTFTRRFIADYGDIAATTNANAADTSQRQDSHDDSSATPDLFGQTDAPAKTAAPPKNDHDGQFDLFNQPEETSPNHMLFPDKDSVNTVAHTYTLVEDDQQLQHLIAHLGTQPLFVFDTETTSIDAYAADIVGLSLCVKAHEAWYIPMPKDYEACKTKLDLLKPLFENPDVVKVGQNLKYDISVLRHYDVEVQGPLFDTMIAHYLIEPEQRHNMDYLADVYLNYVTIPIENLIGNGRNQGSMRDVAPSMVKDYAAEDADITFQLYQTFLPMLKDAGVEKLFYEIEMPLVPVLSTMEGNGVKIDTQNLRQISDEFGGNIVQLEKQIHEMAGTDFNIASPRQLGDVLFNKLRLDDKAKKTKTGQYATGEDVLQKLAGKHPIIQAILDYRSYTKLKSTYLDALPALINPRDGLIHTSYNQAVTATGRLSSNNPNLQNIPVRTAKGREIRRAFVPRSEAFTMMAADYSQIELRIIAHLSGDPTMINDFNLGHDIHTATASKVFHVPLDEVTKEQRSRAKAVNFGIIYGMSAFGLADRLEISRSEAADIIKNYFVEYAGIKEYMNRSIALAKERGYAETILGRRRYLRDINASNATVRTFAERNAINAPIQGSSADMIKIAMIDIDREMRQRGMQSKMILQVHDELVFDAHLGEVETLRDMVNEKMVNALPLSVPVIVEINMGENWLAAH